MKKAILCSMLLAIVYISFSQQATTSPTLTKQDYLLRSKHQKTAAWILMGGGVLSTGVGLAGSGVNPDYGDGGLNTSGGIVFLVTGLAAIGASIPLFIASSKNKKKAADVSFRMERAPQIQQGNFVYRSYTALSFRINL